MHNSDFLSRIARFRKGAAEKRAAFIAYLTAGDPDADATVAMAPALDRAGADVLELGVPFSDPIADGPILQRAAERALSAGTNLDAVFEMAREITSDHPARARPLFVPEPAAAHGRHRASAGGARGRLRRGARDGSSSRRGGSHPPGVPAAGLDTVFLVSPTSPASRHERGGRAVLRVPLRREPAGHDRGAAGRFPPTSPRPCARSPGGRRRFRSPSDSVSRRRRRHGAAALLRTGSSLARPSSRRPSRPGRGARQRSRHWRLSGEACRRKKVRVWSVRCRVGGPALAPATYHLPPLYDAPEGDLPQGP